MENNLKIFENMFISTKCLNCDEFPKCLGYCENHHDKNQIENFLLSMSHDIILHGKMSNNVDFTYLEPCQIDKQEIQNRRLNYIITLMDIKESVRLKLSEINDKYNRQFKHKISLNHISDVSFFHKNFNYEYNCSINYKNIIKLLIDNNHWFLHNKNKFISTYDGLNLIEMQLQTNLLKLNLKILENLLHQHQKMTHEKPPIKIKNYDTTNGLFFKMLMNKLKTEKFKQFYDHIIFAKQEHCEKINNQNLRYDMYFILITNNKNYQKIFIEIDEHQHFCKSNDPTHDILKDIYCLKNGYSLCRYHCKSKCVSNTNIDFVINYLQTIVMTNKQQFYFSDKYIKSKTKTLSTVENEEYNQN